MNAYGGIDGIAPLVLNHWLNGDKLSSSVISRLIYIESYPGTHSKGSVAPRAGLKGLEDIKISYHYRELNYGSSVVNPLPSHYIDWAIVFYVYV